MEWQWGGIGTNELLKIIETILNTFKKGNNCKCDIDCDTSKNRKKSVNRLIKYIYYGIINAFAQDTISTDCQFSLFIYLHY